MLEFQYISEILQWKQLNHIICAKNNKKSSSTCFSLSIILSLIFVSLSVAIALIVN